MVLIPGSDYPSEKMLPTQRKIYVLEHYILALLFMCLIALACMNIWKILIKQGKWRTLPLLFFYIFAMISNVFREVIIIGGFVTKPIIDIMIVTQSPAKLCVGFI